MLKELAKLTRYPVVFYHCTTTEIDEAPASGEGRDIDLQNYINVGTGEEALTIFNNDFLNFRPYPGGLRGYEGIGVMRLLGKTNLKGYLSSIRPRVYTDDSEIRLSKGKSFRRRLKFIAKGHCFILKHYTRYFTVKKRVKLSILIVIYNIIYLVKL